MLLDKGNPEIHSAQELLRRSHNSDGKLEVQVADQTTPPVIVHLNQAKGVTFLTLPASIDDRVISVASTAGLSNGDFISLTNVEANRYYVGYVVQFTIDSIVLDSPLDYAYPIAGTVVTTGTSEMAVDGSVTPEIFSLRATDPGLPVTIDITRLMFECETTGAVDLNKFGDLTALVNGLVLRRVDGEYTNIFNFKKNADFAGVAYDFNVYSASNPQQGRNGFTCRLTFAGGNKIGVALRVGQGEDIQAIIQDDLSGLISFHIIAEGHVVFD